MRKHHPLLPPAGPFTFDILKGISFTIDHITSFDMNAARAHAQRIVDDLTDSLETLAEADLGLPADIDVSDIAQLEALRMTLIAKYIGERRIRSWSGINDIVTREAIPATADNIRALLSDAYIADKFLEMGTQAYIRQLSAKKDCGTVAGGITATAPNTAEDAAQTASPAPKVGVE